MKDHELKELIKVESQRFRKFYQWLEDEMPPTFFTEVTQDKVILITHSLMGFPSQEFFATINLKRTVIVLCLDSSDADLRILQDYSNHGIKDYQTFVSKSPPPFEGVETRLRIAVIYFTEAVETVEKEYPLEEKEKLRALVKARNPVVTNEEFDKLISQINTRFLRALPLERMILVIDMFFRAQTRDNCQYEVRYDQDWEETHSPSMTIVFAWKNAPKHNFLFRIARVIHRVGFVMRRVNASYLGGYGRDSILLMALSLHGSNGQAVWDVADIPDFLRELLTVKYFGSFDLIDSQLVRMNMIPGTLGNFLRAAVSFIHQGLVYLDSNLYTLSSIEKDLCYLPELTVKLCQAFQYKFNPEVHNYTKYLELRNEILKDIQKLDTGQEYNDTRRKNVLTLCLNMIHYTLKTNFFRHNYTALSFRLDPKYLDELPIKRVNYFPELPHAIFYFKGLHFFGFHIRFKELSRGGLRTVYMSSSEGVETEQNSVFSECYNLAHTQQKKNKDIPEGGAKGIIFLTPGEQLESESLILKHELEASKIQPEEVEKKVSDFREGQRLEYLYQAQRAYVESMMTLVNCEPSGQLRAKYIIDYWKNPEYIYLGPDENMHDVMINWIAAYSQKYGYKPGPCFISGKPNFGINHKEYGVTSLGVNVYMHKLLEYLGINPLVDPFTVKISGGPDGDVAGNQIMNLWRYYKKTAKLLALTDVSGTIYDPEGLDLDEMARLFKEGKPMRFYTPEKLHDGGFLLDKNRKRSQSAFSQQTLCLRAVGGKIEEDWLSGNEMNYLLRHNLHRTKTDIFIPGGGRPRTLNFNNVNDFLDEQGNPTSRGIVEGANLYLSQSARRFLEDKGVLIIKDSSANKAGVICSSFEVLSGLTLGEHLFLENKKVLVEQVLDRLRRCAANEAELLLRTHKETGKYLTEISDEISSRINLFAYQILDDLDKLDEMELPQELKKTFLSYCPTLIAEQYADLALKEIPEHHKKAVVACHVAAQVVYKRGLKWYPSIIDILPLLLREQGILA